MRKYFSSNAMEAITNVDLIWIIAALAGLVLAGLLYGLRQYHNVNRELKGQTPGEYFLYRANGHPGATRRGRRTGNA